MERTEWDELTRHWSGLSDGQEVNPRFVFSKGLDFLRSRNSQDKTLMEVAIDAGKADIVGALLDKGIPVVESYGPRDIEKVNFLTYAADKNRAEIVEVLLENGGKEILNQPDRNEHTALSYAALNNNLELVNLLIEYGAKDSLSEASTVPALIENGYRVLTGKTGSVDLKKERKISYDIYKIIALEQSRYLL